VSQGAAPDGQARPQRVDRRWALIALVIVVVLLAVTAGVYEISGRSAQPSASPGDLSAYGQLFAQVGPNGEVTKEMALEAFSLAIAPLPGVTVPSGPAPQPWEQADGTFAIDWIQPFLDRLTPDQKSAYDAALAAPPNTPIISDSGARSPSFMLADASDYTADASILSDARTKELALGGSSATGLKFDYSLIINQTQVDAGEALAYTNPGIEKFADNTTKPYCEIHVNPLLISLSQAHPEFTKASLAHEMWHCIQNAYVGGAKLTAPSWIVEGQAEWVGETLYAQTAIGASWWQAYLQTPKSALYSRTYDGVGFYLHLAEEGISPGPVLLPMLTAANNDAAFQGTGADADKYLDSWSSGLFRDQTLGQDWYATGFSDALIAQAQALWPPKVAPPDPKQQLPIADGDTKQVSAAKVTNSLINLVPSADLVIVQITGHARLKTGALDDVGLQDRVYCTKQDHCVCPPGQIWTGPTTVEYMPANTTSQLALTGGLNGAQGVVVGASIDQFCKPAPSGLPTTPCQNCSSSNGDPHLRTVNRYHYDFQAAGEFVLLRNADSSIEIQGRQEPYHPLLPGPFSGVSTNTAISARDNGHTVGVYVTDGALVLHIDGAQVDPATAPDLGSGASVQSVKNGLQINFPDGTTLAALSVGSWGINAVILPSSSLTSGGMGLLGPITPGGMGVPALPDGTQLPVAPDTETRDKILYGQFADAWRVTDATSLFDYDPGKSTETYTDRNFPSDVARQALESALASPDPNQLAAAQSTCAGLTDADLLSDCEYDVFATGDDGFAQSYAAILDLYDVGIVPSTPGPPATSLPSPGGVVGAQQVVALQDLQGATIGPDNTLYVSIDDSSGAAQLLAVDPTSAAVKAEVPTRLATSIYFAAGSVWASGQTTDANGAHCTVTRYDPATLAKQGDYPIPCGANRLVSMGDAVWFVNTTNTDLSTGAGTVLTQIDPTTNAPGKSIPIPLADGCCQSSQGAIFCYCGNSDEWRLTDNDSAFVDLGNYGQIYPAGDGFWAQQGNNVVFVDGPGGPQTTIALTEGNVGDSLVGGDSDSAYLEGEPPTNQLLRQPADGSPPVPIAQAPTSGTDVFLTTYDYNSGGFPWFATANGYLHLWVFKGSADSQQALWLQWAPLP
jgi:hypothetical protein